MQIKDTQQQEKCLIHIPLFTGSAQDTTTGEWYIPKSEYHKLYDLQDCKKCEEEKLLYHEFVKNKKG